MKKKVCTLMVGDCASIGREDKDCTKCNYLNEVDITGAEAIATERQEQLDKHHWTPEHDKQHVNKELLYAAMFTLTLNDVWWPEDWSDKYKEKIKLKDYTERLSVAGAFIAAEYDRIGE